MPEIQPDLSDQSRCISVHWALPVQCVLPRTHAGIWHEAWNPATGDRIRYRRSMGVYRTEELQDGWHDLRIPPPGEICGEPHSSKPGVFCQWPRKHNETSWTHRALFEGCTYTWNSIRREPTPEQVAQDLRRAREIAAEQTAEVVRLRDAEQRMREQHEGAMRQMRGEVDRWKADYEALNAEVERLRDAEEREAMDPIRTAIAQWQDGELAPHDALTAIQEHIGGTA